jgi:sigma-B regulation protein RsbU (phosphoserine phosphatase)
MVQAAFFPKEGAREGAGEDPGAVATELTDLEVSGFFQAATECGGDWWGTFPCPDGSVFVCIGDATGHGAAAALLTAMAYSCCMTAAAMMHEDQGRRDSPGRLLSRLNQLLLASVGGGRNMTFFVAHFDLAAGVLTYANAAHNFPFLVPASANDDRLTGGRRHQSLVLPGPLLGSDAKAVYPEATIPLRPGDRLVLFTDGLIEGKGKNGRPWGRKRLSDAVAAAAAGGAANPADLVAALRSGAFSHFGETQVADDVTIVVAAVSPRWQRALQAA